MSAKLSFDALKKAVKAGEIDTVITALVDMQGRVQGKRFHAQNFIDGAWQETHCCNYLLATDMEMTTVPGYTFSSWEKGYGDYVMKPDLDSLRLIPWAPGTALVMCDLYDHHTHELVPHAPRTLLKSQLARAKAMGFDVMMATELEFFLFEKSYDDIRRSGFRDLATLSGYNEDYNIMQTTREEYIMRPVRNMLYAAGVPVENSKGEAEEGQQELNIRYAEAMTCADYHTIAKQAVKDISDQNGHAASFMSKWSHAKVGSAAHIHQSLFADGENVFYDPANDHCISATMGAYVGKTALKDGKGVMVDWEYKDGANYFPLDDEVKAMRPQ